MFLFRKIQQARRKFLSGEQKQDFAIIEKEIEVYIESENANISKKIYQKLMETKNK
jgi:hypothetical protein